MKTNFLRLIPKFLAAWLLLISVQGCDNSPDPVVPVGADGYFVVNEGGFNKSNTSISFYDRETGVMSNDIFAARNGRPLGDQSQSITVFEGKAYVVVQNSAKVEVINADDFSSIKTISEELVSPRYFIGIDPDKGYVSDWGDFGAVGSVKVIDLSDMKVVKTILTGEGANKMIRKGDNVYVANSGGFGKNNTISVINTSTDAVVETITVGDNPYSLQFDKDGNLWVGSSGVTVYNDDFTAVDEEKSTTASLSKVGSDNKEALRLTFPRVTYPSLTQLEINPAGDKLYYSYEGAVYSIATTATTLPASPFIDKEFYGLAVDPFNDDIIGMETLNFSSPGKIYIYNSTGTLQKSIEVGIAPNSIGFK
jgi:YVTN family beta-propeller protein